MSDTPSLPAGDGRSDAPVPGTDRRVAVVTGASSGIGEAAARALAGDGWHVVVTARRIDRLQALASEIGGTAVACDVTDREQVAALARAVDDLPGALGLLVNNAGGAVGDDSIEQADPDDWRWMYEINVIGLLQVTQALLPALRASGDGLVLNVGSTAGRIAYEGGAGYTAAKHGTQVVTETLRLELCGEPIRVTEIAPGMVKTPEFSMVRFAGDQEKYDAIYRGVREPLVAEDVAECVRWVASLPHHVNIDEMVVRPRAQAAQHKVHREG